MTALLDAGSLTRTPELDALVEALNERRTAAAGGLWGSSQALVLAHVTHRVQGPWVAVLSTDSEAEAFAEDLRAFGAEPTLLPARESSGIGSGPGRSHAGTDAVRARLQIAQRLAGPPERRPRLLVASLLSMLQPVPSADRLEGEFLSLQINERLDTEELLDRLVHSGYSRQPLVEVPGEISLRGDILDIFPFAADEPVRVELFDDEIESIRSFDPESQRSSETFSRIQVCTASDVGGIEDGDGAQPVSLLAPTAVFVEIEPLRIQDATEGLRIQSSSHQRAWMQLSTERKKHVDLSLQSLPARDVNFDTRSVQSFAVGIPKSPPLLSAAVGRGVQTFVLVANEAEDHRFRQVLTEQGAESVATHVGSIGRGFEFPAFHLIVVNHREISGVKGARRVKRARVAHRTHALQSFFELKPGDLVVHAVHGLARFHGLAVMRRGGAAEEHLKLIFSDEVVLFVPVCRIDLVQRYIGTGSAAPKLDKIGSQSFRKRKERVQRALRDLAADLLEVQARRATREREPWPADDAMVRDLIGSFPYTDTDDQKKSDREIAEDLRSPRPLDRLLCGDVGFGKTELAVRAAFRVVNGGGQVAVLVPTTVLAQQHDRTFRERLADYPVSVETIGRHQTQSATRNTLERLERGEVDILVGTHRILSKDVRFSRLGLVIVDEEQRFGVAHKEHFKSMRAEVDVLTLTATPIPRTLHMSLSGVRDISALAEPPPGRQEIETVLGYRNDDDLLRNAILREKNRGGQVFFLHNRVESIDAFAARLAELCPESSFAVGHGQMGGRELQRVMDSFIRGENDVLVATTIIENGIDIPAAGTILIDEADRFGLSELHQLRGRVGRGIHKAFCYLLIDRHKPLRQAAKDRLKALEEMNYLGAGFGISMKDLEIRGAGNLLGPEQSGHIAAIGYDMYCRLLKQTIERMQELGPGAGLEARDLAVADEPGIELELGLDAYLPTEWISSETARIELLRQLDEIHSEPEADEAAAMLRDRFGRVPTEAAALVRTFRLRAMLEPFGIRHLAWRDEAYLVQFEDRVTLEGLFGRSRAELRPLSAGRALVVPPGKTRSAEEALDWLEGLLRAASEKTTIAHPTP